MPTTKTATVTFRIDPAVVAAGHVDEQGCYGPNRIRP